MSNFFKRTYRRQLLKTIATRRFRRGREETEIGVDAGRARMIIAESEMGILAQPVGIAPHDESAGMRPSVQPRRDDMGACLLQSSRPLMLAEARLVTDQAVTCLPLLAASISAFTPANRRSSDKVI
jgi:hypothetical protein